VDHHNNPGWIRMRSSINNVFPTAATILLLVCLSGMAKAHGQGTVIFANLVKGSTVSHVYLPSPTTPGLIQIGNGPTDLPAGTTDWSGWTPVSGGGFSAQLFAANGADAPVDSLSPAFPVTTFHTGTLAGFVNATTATLTGVPIDAEVATVQMRVWDNKGGLISDWASALAQPPGTETIGMSAPLDVYGIGVPPLGIPPTLLGLQSFNLTYNVPEPTAFALAGFGALLLWLASLSKRRDSNQPRRETTPNR
jgi:hypothetical protein